MNKTIQVSQISVPLAHTKEEIFQKACALAQIPTKKVISMQIMKQSVDARKKATLNYTYTVRLVVDAQQKIRKNHAHVQEIQPVTYQIPKKKDTAAEEKQPIAIVGAGPAGLFAAYLLAQCGYCPNIYERGKEVSARQQDVEAFWSDGSLNLESNVQFGEGGAGTFSDGKLNTLVKDKFGRSRYVLETFVKFGAPEDILYVAKPHVGTDVLRTVVERMRQEIIGLGGTFHFSTKVTDLHIKDGKISEIELNHKEWKVVSGVVLAIGHSARDTFQMLYERQIPMAAKSFAVGMRVEHPQQMINESQYGTGADMTLLPTAAYKVTHQASNGRGVYSFCMCPGGYVVNASSEENCLAVNGMSYRKRDSHNANSAIIISVTPADFPDKEHPLSGVAFQRMLEEKTWKLAEGKVPQQLYGDFKQNRASTGYGSFDSCVKGLHGFANLRSLFPEAVNEAFCEGMEAFGRKIRGFNREDCILSGVESRTSSPVRIHRDESFQSEIRGLYPCGEGAGYAGGIMSAAMDGLKVAEAIVQEIK
ncbi:NAD(P)/FAD-dependent oxidoreductase [uncultured Eubacterium sp.]|uniref:NAD(P)/FAD-dependent oxidoreductase n=1 Tax=uncultured Eubacterium sp. TaxID=165185 RepID=UPI0025EA2E81|nr:NAD(P)-binding protein [uncultured Eubacterium sp.]